VQLAVARAHSAADADAWATALLLLGTAPVEFREVG
jgi:thiamine biosynthesis lipoprotein ApbE